MNVSRKYCKRTVFDQLEFEAFIAGETRVIHGMQDYQQAKGLLEFLSKVAHWLCKCKDWNTVRGLYEAVLESIKLGEETWLSDFSHYESMIPTTFKPESRDKERSELWKRDKEKVEVFWCKNYQRNNCTESSLHMAQVRPENPPVPVLHLCVLCLQREGKRAEHPEAECLAKK